MFNLSATSQASLSSAADHSDVPTGPFSIQSAYAHLPEVVRESAAHPSSMPSPDQ